MTTRADGPLVIMSGWAAPERSPRAPAPARGPGRLLPAAGVLARRL